jgi:hypothetical protein
MGWRVIETTIIQAYAAFAGPGKENHLFCKLVLIESFTVTVRIANFMQQKANTTREAATGVTTPK